MASIEDVQGEFQTVDEGPFAGWRVWIGNAFETHTGPFAWRFDTDGRVTGGSLPDERNMNDAGMLHGGALMTFADAVAGVVT